MGVGCCMGFSGLNPVSKFMEFTVLLSGVYRPRDPPVFRGHSRRI